MTDEPGPRPAADADLGFTPRPAVRWFHPSVLADAGLRVLVSLAFGAFLDKRELQGALDTQPLDHHADDDELWIDYIADTGDGFSATYTTAWLASQRELHPTGATRNLPRGDLLVLGGDEVYPVASAAAYEDRLSGPYAAALPWSAGPRPDLYAIPGNHDWYDGLTAFMRVFCQRKSIGGRQTRQDRSYFALRLPHRWWLWGIDIQFDAYVDDPQIRYFRDIAENEMEPGDRVILCTAVPSWVKAHHPGSYRNLAYVERKLLVPYGLDLRLTLAGDYHHYSRYSGDDGTHKVTAGGGGAFLHPTHGLPEQVVLPPVEDSPAATMAGASGYLADPDEPIGPRGKSDVRHPGDRVFRQAAVYPDPPTSRRLLWRCLALPVRNPRFTTIPAALSVVLLWALLHALRLADPAAPATLRAAAAPLRFGELAAGLLASPVALLTLLALAGALVGFARPSARWPRPAGAPWAPKVVLGLAHAAAHVLAFLAVSWASVRLLSAALAAGLPVAVLFVVVAIGGGVAGGLVFGAYLGLVNALPGHAHGNEAFSALRIEDHKSFLRLHIDHHGALRLYAIGVDRVCHDWDYRPDVPDPEAPWLAPRHGTPQTRIIDGPVLIDPGEGPEE